MFTAREWVLVLVLGVAAPVAADGAAAEKALPAPACVGDAHVAEASITGNALELCFVEKNIAQCWSFDLVTQRWTPRASRPYEFVAPLADVKVTGKTVAVCKADRSDCKSVPLPFTPLPDDPIGAAANADRSLIALTHPGAVRVLDMSGRQLTAIRPWHTAMAGEKGVSFFRSAAFAGSALAVYIADTPVTSAVRLYHPRSGKIIGNVNQGRPMSDAQAPVALGKNQFAFVEFDTSRIVIHDVTTGRLVRSYHPGKAAAPGGYSFLAAPPDGRSIWGISGAAVIRFDTASGKVARFEPPRCKAS